MATGKTEQLTKTMMFCILLQGYDDLISDDTSSIIATTPRTIYDYVINNGQGYNSFFEEKRQ